jgi:hypothetical protein
MNAETNHNYSTVQHPPTLAPPKEKEIEPRSENHTHANEGYVDLAYKLPNFLLMKEMQMREASKLGWVIEFAKHVWAEFLLFPVLAITFHY